MKISVVSGGFDPIHSGHISYLKDAKSYGEILIVALNSDNWLINKKGQNFLTFKERRIILESLEFVDEVIDFVDDEMGSCINALKDLKNRYPSDEIIFCNGGDRTDENIPEMEIEGISFQFRVGGDDKLNSSSMILKNWKYLKEKRSWGTFYELFQDKNIKLKELIVEPKQGMSFQRHFHRNELWFVSEGSCEVNHSKSLEDETQTIVLNKNDFFHIDVEDWHQITNPNDVECKIIEIQYGEKTEEEDIERLFYYEQKD
tara:strand:+ start:1118 stop:1894 length:777 start_codon:yes stop_codon:yes gene_type:complete